MQWYNLEHRLALSAYFLSLIEKFSWRNGSVIHNKNAPSHFSSPYFSQPESPQLSQENTLSEIEEIEKLKQTRPSSWSQRLTVKPTDYAKFHNQ